MCDVAYNGGYAGMQLQHDACGQRGGCELQKRSRHVELTCLQFKRPQRADSRAPYVVNPKLVFPMVWHDFYWFVSYMKLIIVNMVKPLQSTLLHRVTTKESTAWDT